MTMVPGPGDLRSLKSVPLFRQLDPAELDSLWRAANITNITASAEIFSQGDPPDAVYAIVGGDGCVRIGAVDRQSKALMVEVFQVGDVFGEIGVIEGKPRTASAVAEGPLRLLRISASAFRDTLAKNPALGDAVCRMLARRLRRTFELFQDATFESVEVRLARQILYLADVAGRADRDGLRLGRRLRQSDLADLLGVTNRSIITVMNAWRAAGIVSYNTRTAILTVTNRPTLQGMLPQTHDEAAASAVDRPRSGA